jgi:hypothetical protein
MPNPDSSVLAQIHRLASSALQEGEVPLAIRKVLEEIVSLAQSERGGDTPEASDPVHTENQTL